MAAPTPAITALDRQRVTYTLLPYQAPADAPDYGRVVADALGLDPAQVFKTLIAEVDGALVVAVVPVTGELDPKALAAALGGRRAAIADRTVAERASGYVRGGISPFGQRRQLPAVVDSSAAGFDTVYVSAGRRGLQVALAPADLLRVTGATAAPIAR